MSLRLIELFSGIGAHTQALKNLGVEHSVVATSDIDTYANCSYELLHGKANNLGDITKIQSLPECDLLFYSSCCQSISMSGKREGFKEGSNTASSLIWEVGRLLQDYKDRNCLPKYLVLENVEAITFKHFEREFRDWLDRLSSLGYTNFYQVLDAGDFSLGQHRDRLFCVSILDCDSFFMFPERVKSDVSIRAAIEYSVPAKYYLSKAEVEAVGHNQLRTKKRKADAKARAKVKASGELLGLDVVDYVGSGGFRQTAEVLGIDGKIATLDTCCGGNRVKKIKVDDGLNLIHALERQAEGGKAGALGTKCGSTGCDSSVMVELNGKGIRRITPREALRLMGWKDSQIDKIIKRPADCIDDIKSKVSDSQIYRQAGNSIAVPVLMALFGKLLGVPYIELVREFECRGF